MPYDPKPEHSLIRRTLNTYSLINRKRQQLEEVEEDQKDEGNNKNEGRPQQVDSLAEALTAKRVVDTHLSYKEDGSPARTRLQQPLPSRELSLEPSHDKARSDCDSNSDD
jgi:hypothetical protein